MKKSLTYAQKHKQIKKEAKWTFALFLFCFLWWTITGWGLNTIDIYFYHLPLWWWLSCVGLYIIGSLGCIWLVKTKFVDFDLDEDELPEDTLSGDELPEDILPEASVSKNRASDLSNRNSSTSSNSLNS